MSILTTPNDLMKSLQAPFPAEDIEWRVAQADKDRNGNIYAMVLAYVSARAIQNRLDEVVGPDAWKVSYSPFGGVTGIAGGVMCQLSVRIGSEWVTKEDGAEQTDFEPFKGGISSALKRAGSAWGIGRYLYMLESGYADISPTRKEGYRWGKTKGGDSFYWAPPQLPDWALPAKEKPAPSVTINGVKSVIIPKSSGVDMPSAAPAVTPIITPKAAPAGTPVALMTRAEVAVAIREAAKMLSMSPSEITDWSKSEFKKPTDVLSLDEMRSFLEQLQREIGMRNAK